MPEGVRRIVALGGGGFQMEAERSRLDDFVLGLSGAERPRVCLIPTATGDRAEVVVSFLRAFAPPRAEPSFLPLFSRDERDLEAELLSQDVVYVAGGNTANLLAIWRAHGLPPILRRAWEAGVVLAGVSAGGLCWFEGGVTDSFGRGLSALTGGLGLIPGTFCPHYGNEPRRAPRLEALLREGLSPGWAASDGAALLFEGGPGAGPSPRAVRSRADARVYRYRLDEGCPVVEQWPTLDL